MRPIVFSHPTSRLEREETNELLNSQLNKTKMNVEPTNNHPTTNNTTTWPRSIASRTSADKINDPQHDVRKSSNDRPESSSSSSSLSSSCLNIVGVRLLSGECVPARHRLSSWSSHSCLSSSLKWLILIMALALFVSNIHANQATTTASSTATSEHNGDKENDHFLMSPPLATNPSDEHGGMRSRLRFRRGLISQFSKFKNRFSISHYQQQQRQRAPSPPPQQQRARKPSSSFFASRTLLPTNYNGLSSFVKNKLNNIVVTINDYNDRHYNNRSRSIKNSTTETTSTEAKAVPSSLPASIEPEQIETNGAANDDNTKFSSANNNNNDDDNDKSPGKELNKNRRNDIDMLMSNEFLVDNNPRTNANNVDNGFANNSQHVSPTLNIIDVEPDNTKIAHNILLVHRKNAASSSTTTRVPPPPVVISSNVNVKYAGQTSRDQSNGQHYRPTSGASSTADEDTPDESSLDIIPMKSNHKPSTFLSFSEWKQRNKLKTSTTSTTRAPTTTTTETPSSTGKKMSPATTSPSYITNLIINNDHPTSAAATATTTTTTPTPSSLTISGSQSIHTVYHHHHHHHHPTTAAHNNHDQQSFHRPTTSFLSSNSILTKHNLPHAPLAAQINIIDSHSVNTNNNPHKASTGSATTTTAGGGGGGWHDTGTTTSPTTTTTAASTNKISSLITISYRPTIIKLPYTSTTNSGESTTSSFLYTTRPSPPPPPSSALINSNGYWNSFTTTTDNSQPTTEGVTEFDLPGTDSSINDYYNQNVLADAVTANQTNGPKVFESTTTTTAATAVTDNPTMTVPTILDKSDNLENKDLDTIDGELVAQQGYTTLPPYANITNQLNMSNVEHMYHGSSHKTTPFANDDGIFVFKNNHGKPTRPISVAHHHHHQHQHQHQHQQQQQQQSALPQHTHNHQAHLHRHTARPPYVTDFNYPMTTTTTTTKKPFISISNINSHRVKQPDEIKSSSLTILDPIFIQGLMELPLNTTIVHKNILVPMKKGRPKPNYPIRPTTQFPILPMVAGVTNWQQPTTEWIPPAITTSSPDKIDLIPVADSKPGDEFDLFSTTVIPPKTVHKVITIFPATTAQTVTASFTAKPTTSSSTTERPIVVTPRPTTSSTAYVNAIYAPPMPLLHHRPSHSLEAPTTGSWLTAITKLVSRFTGEGGINFMSVFRTVIYSLMLMVLPPLAMATSMSLL